MCSKSYCLCSSGFPTPQLAPPLAVPTGVPRMTGWGEMTVSATGDIHWIPAYFDPDGVRRESRGTSGIAFASRTSNNNKIVPFVLLDLRLWRGLYVFKVLLPLFFWIPDTPVGTAFGGDNWGAENDGVG